MLLIINPISGTSDKQGLADRIVASLGARGIDVQIACTERAGHATELAAQAVAEGFDAVLACGGDGTVNETATAMCGTGVPLGIIPAGSGNGLARHMEIPMDAMASLDVIAEGHVEDCDYGTVNGRPFFCTFGVGFDAAVSDRFASSGSRGKLTYVRSAIAELMHYRPRHYRMVVDGRSVECDAFILACANASQYGNNAYIAPHASIRDGMLDLIAVASNTPLSTAMMGIDMMSGTLDHNRTVEVFRFRHAVIERDEDGPGHIDGEPATLGRRMEVECHPGQLRLFTRRDKRPFRPIITPARSMLEELMLRLHI